MKMGGYKCAHRPGWGMGERTQTTKRNKQARCWNKKCWPNLNSTRIFYVGVLWLIGYLSLSENIALGNMIGGLYKGRSQADDVPACCEQFEMTCSVSISVRCGENNYNAEGEVQFLFLY